MTEKLRLMRLTSPISLISLMRPMRTKTDCLRPVTEIIIIPHSAFRIYFLHSAFRISHSAFCIYFLHSGQVP